MVKSVLVTGEFTEVMEKAGAALLRRLDTGRADVRSAFWFYLADVKAWKFVIASKKVDLEGPREFYKRIVEANKAAAKSEHILSLNDIGVTNMTNPVVVLIGIAVRTPPGEVGSVRFSRNTINGHFIEDAYIYRSSTRE
ncbi:hypothetical protein [Janthinobacterium aquaticum]|uniref:hypothetical protein n=1 Tax=Janthinobacterium sp. FT58W TaxID=2654254 RepID=UPI0012642471|nr:hypothetical protein [Janthinobacterium sp. FT58W]KAB8041668.1 hypothetical protein GCM43_17800 [Janthinobacterium sp. FT58W]